jgi:hypothetical protein
MQKQDYKAMVLPALDELPLRTGTSKTDTAAAEATAVLLPREPCSINASYSSLQTNLFYDLLRVSVTVFLPKDLSVLRHFLVHSRCQTKVRTIIAGDLLIRMPLSWVRFYGKSQVLIEKGEKINHVG